MNIESSYLIKLLIEAIIVGIITVICGLAAGYIVSRIEPSESPKECKEWNKNHVMEKSLFLAGIFIHLSCEFLQINKYYCKNGLACQLH